MRWVVVGICSAGFLLCALPARAAEPCVPAALPTPCAAFSERAETPREEQRSFEQALARFTKLWDFTRSLIEREGRAFEIAADHQARFVELTRKLETAEQRAMEREFEREVLLYVRKRELTRELAAAERSRTGAVRP